MNATTKNSLVTGMGVLTPIGIGLPRFAEALSIGKTNFSIKEFDQGKTVFKFPAATLNGFNFKEAIAVFKPRSKIDQQCQKVEKYFTQHC